MVEDISSILGNIYKSNISNSATDMTDNLTTDNGRVTKDGLLDLRGYDEITKHFRQIQNELITSLKDIDNQYRDIYANIRDLATDNNLVQHQEEEKLVQYKLDNYKKLYNVINDDNREIYTNLVNDEAKIYQSALDNKRKLTNAEISNLKEIEVKKLLTEENGTKKALQLLKQEYNNRSTENKNHLEELEKQEIEIYLARQNRGDEFTKDELKRLKQIENERLKIENEIEEEQEKNSNKWGTGLKNIINTIFTHLAQLANYSLDVLYSDQMKAGMSEFASSYEQNFTELAGRFGTNRNETHNLIGSGLSNINNNDVLSKALNYSKEVMPAIVEASQAGFMGEEAIEIGITRALDKKIMPWLDTNSETWTQLEYNLSNDSLNQIKGQQLLLQETREGNRILQTGIADTLLNELAPTIQAIDANTTTKESMGAAYEAVEQLMAKGLDKTSAVKFVKDAIEADQHKARALTSNDPSKIIMAMGAMNGGGVEGAVENYSKIAGQHMSSVGDNEIALDFVQDLWGSYLPASFSNFADVFKDLDIVGKYDNNLESSYAKAADNAVEKLTATQEHDNEIQNEYAEKILNFLQYPHASDIAIKTFEEVVQIRHWLVTALITGLGSLLTNGLGGGGNFLTKGLSKLLTGGKGFSAAVNAGSTATKLAPGLKTGGLIGGLTHGGTALSGGVASGPLATGIGALGVAGSAYSITKGIGTITDTFKNWNKSSAADNTVGLGTGAMMVGGGGMLGAAALGLASGPVGWAGLAIGGIGMGIKAIYDHSTRLSGMAKQVEAQAEEIKTAFKQEQDARIDNVSSIKESIDEAKTLDEARSIAVNSGLVSEQTAREMSASELTKFATSVQGAEQAISAMGDSVIDAKTKIAKNEMQKQTKDVLNTTFNRYLDLIQAGDSKKVMGKEDENYEDVKNSLYGMAYSITNEKQQSAMIKQLDAMFANEMLSVDELRVLFNKNTYSSHRRATWSKAIDTANNFYDYGVDAQRANAALSLVEGTGHWDTTEIDAIQNTASITAALDTWYNKYKNAKTTNDKNGYKDQFLNVWNNQVKPVDEYYNYLKPQYEDAAKDMGIKEFRLGSSLIPWDMLAFVHYNERILTAEQNKKYTEDLISGNSTSSIIQAGIQDILIAIKSQTTDIINYLSSMNFTGSALGLQMNMNPAMGNTKVII